MAETAWLSTAPKVHSPTVGATASIDPTVALCFRITPTETLTVNATSVGYPNQIMNIIFDTVGTSSYTTTFGTNFRSTGTLASGTTSARRFIVSFLSDGLGWSEICRTAAQA